MTNPQNDIAKWNAFKSGDRTAFEEIFREFHGSLLQYGSKICADQELLEDAVQDLFLEIWQSSSQAPVLSVKAYLFKALKYKLFRAMKEAAKKRKSLFQQSHPEFSFPHDTFLIGREEEAIQSEKLQKALQKLPSRQREIVYLRIYQNLDYSGISEIMGINYQVARNLFYQSMKSLRVAFDQ